ncbi:hypothetical protein Vretimale_4007 [Volvox reticuliferus]|uniref:DNA-directed DNA polymerase X domain-containing protein n=1 Tax=Volvox reticuliferus TaxID=1737510 RepID=A0A8J4DA95_9CHLO|nr:hypothetical protein Vretimale_4007 [Volvox reticuliferus]
MVRLQLYPGDKIFLERRDGRLVSGLELRATGGGKRGAAGGDGIAAATAKADPVPPPRKLTSLNLVPAAQQLATPNRWVSMLSPPPPPLPLKPGSPPHELANTPRTRGSGESVTRGIVVAPNCNDKSVQLHWEEAQQQGQAAAAVAAPAMADIPLSSFISYQPLLLPDAAEDVEPPPDLQAAGGTAPQALCVTCTVVSEPAVPTSEAPSRCKRRRADVSLIAEPAPRPVAEATADTAATGAACDAAATVTVTAMGQPSAAEILNDVTCVIPAKTTTAPSRRSPSPPVVSEHWTAERAGSGTEANRTAKEEGVVEGAVVSKGGHHSGGGGGIFRNCRFVFWARHQAREVLARVKLAGGQEQYSVGLSTTHVVARYDTSAEEASHLLRTSDLEYDTAAAASFLLPHGVLFVTLKYIRDCLEQGRRFVPDPAAGHLIQLAARQRHSVVVAAAAPPTVAPLPMEQPPSPPEQSLSSRDGGVGAAVTADTTTAADAAAASSFEVHNGNRGGGGGGGIGGCLSGPDVICARPEDWGVDDRWIEPWDKETANRTCMLLLRHWQKHSYDTNVQLLSPSALDAADAGGGTRQESYDSGADGDGTAADGSDGDSGSRTPRIDHTLISARLSTPNSGGGGGSSGGSSGHWRRRPRRRHSSPITQREASDDDAAAGIAAVAAKHGSTTSTPMAAADANAAADRCRHRINAVCSHPCCAARPFCILAELKRTRDLYLGREDQFRIKAVDRAMGILVRMSWPLEAPDQLKQLHLGRGSEEKVAEILATGRLSRNDAYEHDEKQVTIRKFMQVWGCGESTARRWWASGSRSLDDVRQRTDLTAQQRLGLRHFDDFQHRIPRAEVSLVATVVRRVTIESLQALTQLPYSALLDRLHVRPMGSYARGSASSADVDFIIAPSPQADPRVGPYDLLTAIVARLEAGGYLDVDSARMIETRQDHFRGHHRPAPIRFHHDHHDQERLREVREQQQQQQRNRSDVESATWLGVWRMPDSGRYCRVDIKCYRRRLLPYAVTYFSSGIDFNRALRYWASSPPPHVRQLARAIHPRADAFRLSDKELAVVERRPRGASASSGGVVEYVLTSVPCSCETDVFRALGLSYVPPSMRDITRVE